VLAQAELLGKGWAACGVPDMAAKIDIAHHALDQFANKWLTSLWDRGTDNQRKAALHVWVRYFASVRALHHLRDKNDLPDGYATARVCLEMDAALQAICEDARLGDDYMEFEKHAKNRYLNYVTKAGELDEAVRAHRYLQRRFGKNYHEHMRDKWCTRYGGVAGLFRRLNRHSDYARYSLYSNFTHGSIVAIELLNKQGFESQRILTLLLTQHFGCFLGRTRSLLNLLWGPLVLLEGEKCKGEFLTVMKRFI
jgi:hypothetical protein